MTGEPETVAEVETPIGPVDEEFESPDQTPATEEVDGQETEPTTEDDDLEEVEFNGKQFKAPRGLKDSLLMQADYTRKTQETAALKRELEARAETLAQQASVGEEEMQARASLIGIEAELGRYQGVDWERWSTEDPIAAQQGYIRYQEMIRAQQHLSTELKNRGESRTREAQQDLAKRIEETRSFAQKEIKGWSADLDRQVLDYAKQEGVSTGELQRLMSPTLYKILHKAMVGHQTLTKTVAAAKPQTTQIKPLETVAAKASPPARKTLESMSMDEYAAEMNRREAQRGRR
jgi:hypothetical protein